ncbi:mycothiol conjugate amidase Mca [Nakamurella aerolata]
MMAVHAHPDDESSKGAATLAKYSDEGIGVMVVSCTGGERGDVLNPKFAAAVESGAVDMPALRQREMADAASILGISHVWLGFHDSGYHEGEPDTWQLPPDSFGALDPDVEIEALVRVVRRFRPQVMTTYDENGGYPHPDHIRCHVISMAAFDAAADPARYPDAGEPWQVSKIYYNGGFSRTRLTAINEAVKSATGTGPFDEWIARIEESGRPDRSDRITTRVPVGEYLERRDAALRAHATQIDPDAHWFAVPREIEAKVWGTDDYELAESRIPVQLPEDDLFAGLRPSASVGAGSADAGSRSERESA